MGETLTDRLIAYLEANKASFEVMIHDPVRTSEEAAQARGTSLEQGAKALVFRADDRVVLLVLPANQRVDSRGFKRSLGVKNLRMISAGELTDLTGLEVGAVPPFGNLMDLPTYVDERLLGLPRIAFNAGSRRISIVMSSADYRRLANPSIGHFTTEGIA